MRREIHCIFTIFIQYNTPFYQIHNSTKFIIYYYYRKTKERGLIRCMEYVLENTVTILLTKITAAQNEVALSYHCMRDLYFLAVIFAATIKTVLQHDQQRLRCFLVNCLKFCKVLYTYFETLLLLF